MIRLSRSTDRTQPGALMVRRVALVLGLLFCPLAGADAQLSLDRIELVLVPGTAGGGDALFSVLNSGTEALTARVYSEDWDRDGSGTNKFYPVGSTSGSCGRLVTHSPQALRLEPGNPQVVRVRLQNADSLNHSCWTVVFVEARLPMAAGQPVGHVLRAGVKVYVEPRGLSRDGTIASARVVQGRTSAARKSVEFTFSNTGGLKLVASGRLEIRATDNRVVATVRVPEFPTLPGSSRLVTVPLPALERGRYVGLLLLDFGGAELIAAQIELDG